MEIDYSGNLSSFFLTATSTLYTFGWIAMLIHPDTISRCCKDEQPVRRRSFLYNAITLHLFLRSESRAPLYLPPQSSSCI